MGKTKGNYATQDTTGGATRTVSVPAGRQWKVKIIGLQGNGVAGAIVNLNDGTNDYPLCQAQTLTDAVWYYFPSQLNQDQRPQVGDQITLDYGWSIKFTWGNAAKTPASFALVEEVPL